MDQSYDDFSRKGKAYSKNMDLRSYAGIATFFQPGPALERA
jgi:hypothetical protein